MPRRSILSAAERDSLLALPDTQDELIRLYTFSEPDLSLIRQRRGDANRLGVAVQLCLLRFPGQGLLPDAAVPMPLLQWIGRQLRIDPSCWPQYAEREETRREHLLELRAYLGMEPFGLAHYRQAVHAATELALQTDKGIMLANSVLDDLRHRHVILPTLDVVERVCAEAITRAGAIAVGVPLQGCARAGVTTGEWSQTLREEFGEFRAPTGVSAASALIMPPPATITACSAVSSRSRIFTAWASDMAGVATGIVAGKGAVRPPTSAAQLTKIRGMASAPNRTTAA